MAIQQACILERVAMPSRGSSPNPGIEPRSPALQADTLSAEPPGKPYICVYVYIIVILSMKPLSKEQKECLSFEVFYC